MRDLHVHCVLVPDDRLVVEESRSGAPLLRLAGYFGGDALPAFSLLLDDNKARRLGEHLLAWANRAAEQPEVI